MKNVVVIMSALLMFISTAHADVVDTTLADGYLNLAFETGEISKSQLPVLAARFEEVLLEDGSLDPKWLKDQHLVQLEADLTPFSRKVKLTNGKKVLSVNLD